MCFKFILSSLNCLRNTVEKLTDRIIVGLLLDFIWFTVKVHVYVYQKPTALVTVAYNNKLYNKS